MGPVSFGVERIETVADERSSWNRKIPTIDVVLAPSNGMALLGWALVATAEESRAIARELGAKVFCPIHDSQTSFGWLGGPTSHRTDLLLRQQHEAGDVNGQPQTQPQDSERLGDPEIVFLQPGEPIIL